MTAARQCRHSDLTAILLLLCLFLPSMLLADARSDGERGIEEYRKGNLIEGMALLQKSAASGYAPAQTTLAFILDAAEDNDAAFRWYRAAADASDAEGLFGLGGMYAKGEGAVKDPKKAGQLIHQAALLDHRQAMRVYAHALEHGQLGFRTAPGEAVAWYHRAAERGDRISMQRLQRAHDQGQLGLPVNSKKAAEWAAKIRTSE